MKMAYEIIDLKGFLLVVLLSIPLTLSTNIDCGGKPFHCLNSTHFMICVDLGGGLSTTIDDFIIPCPSTTECQKGNRFECEFPKNEVPTTPPYVTSILENYEKSLLPQTMDKGATISPIEKNKVSPMLPKVESTTPLFKSEILEKIKEEFTGGNEKVFEGNIILPTSTVSSTYSVDEIRFVDSKINCSIKNTEKLNNFNLNAEASTVNAVKASEIVVPKEQNIINPTGELLIDFLTDLYVPSTVTQTYSFTDATTSINETDAFSTTHHNPSNVPFENSSQMPTLSYNTEKYSTDILFKHQQEYTGSLQNTESTPASLPSNVNKTSTDILNFSSKAFETHSTHNESDGKSNNSVTVIHINKNTDSPINHIIESSTDVPHKQTFFDKYFTTASPIETTTENWHLIVTGDLGPHYSNKNNLDIKPLDYRTKNITVTANTEIQSTKNSMLDDLMVYYSVTTERNLETTIQPTVFNKYTNKINITQVTKEVVEPITPATATVTEVIQNVIPAPQFLDNVSHGNMSHGIDLSFTDKESNNLNTEPANHIQTIESNKHISINSVFDLNSTVMNAKMNISINKTDIADSVALNLTTLHEINNATLKEIFVDFFEPTISVKSEYEASTSTISFPFSAYTTENTKNDPQFQYIVQKPLLTLKTTEDVPLTILSTEVPVFTATMVHTNNVYSNNEILSGNSNQNKVKDTATSDSYIKSKIPDSIFITSKNSLTTSEIMGPNIEPPELVHDSTLNRVTLKPHNSEVKSSTFAVPTTEIIETVFNENQFVPSTLTEAVTKRADESILVTMTSNNTLSTSNVTHNSSVSEILKSHKNSTQIIASENSTKTNAPNISVGSVNNSLEITEQLILNNPIFIGVQLTNRTLPSNETQTPTTSQNSSLVVNSISNFQNSQDVNFVARNDPLISNQANNEIEFVANCTSTTCTTESTQQTPVVNENNKNIVKAMEYTIPQDILKASASNLTNNGIQISSISITKVDNHNKSSDNLEQPQLPQVKSKRTTLKTDYSSMNGLNISSVITNEFGTTTNNNIGNNRPGITTNSNIDSNRSSTFNCTNSPRGKYADSNDCRKFYFCLGNLQPSLGICPNNTVFSEINKQCTKNLSHCVRNNQFHCLHEGRFTDLLKDNIYYICVKHKVHGYLRYKLQCDKDYHLNRVLIKCEKNIEKESELSLSNSNISNEKSDKTDFECKKDGLFAYANDCRKYYLCTKISDDEYSQKIKTCSSEEMFDDKKKKCVSSESNEC